MTYVAITQLPSLFDALAQSSPCELEPPVPSSKVTNTAVAPVLYAVLLRIWFIHLLNHASPVATEQSCMSLQRLCVINEKLGNVLLRRSSASGPPPGSPSGTSY